MEIRNVSDLVSWVESMSHSDTDDSTGSCLTYENALDLLWWTTDDMDENGVLLYTKPFKLSTSIMRGFYHNNIYYDTRSGNVYIRITPYGTKTVLKDVKNGISYILCKNQHCFTSHEDAVEFIESFRKTHKEAVIDRIRLTIKENTRMIRSLTRNNGTLLGKIKEIERL